jgi:hypothetical protein
MQALQRFQATLARSAGLAALTLVLIWPVRASAQTFTFSATDSASGTYSYGVLDVSNNGNGTYTATGGYLIVLSGPIAGTYALFPNPNPPGTALSPSGAFIFNDQLYPGQSPTLDVFGLLFTGGGLEINIWNDGGGVPYTYFAFNTNNGTFPIASAEDAGFTLGSTAAPMIEILQSVVQELVTIGVMLPANGNSLEAKLNAALSSVEKGNKNAAKGQLGAFINQVNALINNGTIPASLGQSLIDQANAAIAALGG